MRTLVLRSAAVGVGAIGLAYLAVPSRVLAVYGVTLRSVTELAIIRSAYGGLFVSFAVLFELGARRAELARAALAALAVFMGGFALGRIVSLAVDGVPHPLLVAILVVEVAYAGAAARLLALQRASVEPA